MAPAWPHCETGAAAAPTLPASAALDRRELPADIGSHGELTLARVDRLEACDMMDSSLHLLPPPPPPVPAPPRHPPPSEDLMLP